MKKHFITIILCITAGLIAFITFYMLFEIGFRLYANTLPRYNGDNNTLFVNRSNWKLPLQASLGNNIQPTIDPQQQF